MKFKMRWWVIPAVMLGAPCALIAVLALICLGFLLVFIDDFLIFPFDWLFRGKTWKQHKKDQMTAG